ncbi:phage tail protein [Streptomyces ossamyceticus]|uniref:phage tail protein n=1 Tax=Streptomyces ossamyceticus TaxID=249581 RepID=UPI0036EAF518
MAGDDVTITIRADSGDAIRAFRDVNGQLRDMRGRFASESSIMSRSMNQFGRSIGNIKGYLIPLATAATPLLGAMTAATVKTAGAAAGAGVAVGAFGAALAGQVSSLSEASDAQKKYSDAVAKSGRGSKEAAEAQRAVQTALAGMPNATARASVALTTLKDTFRAWSDDLAGFTMAPVEKSFTILGQLLPKLTPMVQGTSTQLDRLLSVAGGAMATPGFDALTEKFADFANRSLREGVDGIIHFTRALSEGQANGPIQTFMEFAEANGPALKETLTNVGNAVMTLMEASAEAGPGMLTLVNAGLQLVAALPPELVATVMQLAVGLKLVTLAGAGAAVAADGVRALGARITALSAASAAAGGGIAGLKAAFLSLGMAAKASIVVAGIAAVAVAFGKLGELGREAPPNVEKLATSLGQLGRTGKVSGEAARVFGKDLDGLYDKVRNITDPSTVDQIQNGLVKVFSLGMADSTPSQEARKALDGIDDSLSNLVKGGKADVAAAAFKRLKAEYVAGGGSVKDFTNQMDGYKASLADAKFEQQLAADSMGIFGSAAQDTSAKLDAQKSAADGLRASILALNDVNRDAHDAQTQFEASLDGLTESFKEHGNTLNADTEAGRANRDAMSAAASAQDELIASGIAAGDSLGSMTKKSDELRETMMRLATDAFGGNKKAAKEYVDQLLGTPSDIKTLVKLEREEAITGLEAVRTAIQATPDAKEIKVDTLNAAAIAALEAVGLKTKQLPDGRTAVFTANGQALGSIGSVSTALNNLNGKTAYTFTKHTIRYITEYQKRFLTGRSQHDITGATGGLYTGRAFKRGYADGGLVEGPGTGTSDDVFAPWLSNGEFVMRAAAVQKYGEKFMQMLNAGAIDMPKMAKGGRVGVRSLARGARDEIRAATSGATEDRLLKLMSSIAGGHLKMATALKKVSGELDKASSKLKDLKSSASQLSDSVKSGIMSAANIARGGDRDQPVTVRSVMGGLVASRDKATAFADALKRLRKRGLSSSLLRQVAEAGIEGGGLETAGALLRASGSEIRSLNSLQSQISGAAGSAGKTTADAVYGKQIKAQERLVKSLDRLADVLKAITTASAAREKAKGKVRKKAAGGIAGGLTWVGEEGPELVRLPQGSTVYPAGQSQHMAWQSMLNAPAVGGPRQVSALPPDSQPIVVQLKIGNRDLGEVWVDVGRKAVRAHGSIEAALKTTR